MATLTAKRSRVLGRDSQRRDIGVNMVVTPTKGDMVNWTREEDARRRKNRDVSRREKKKPAKITTRIIVAQRAKIIIVIMLYANRRAFASDIESWTVCSLQCVDMQEKGTESTTTTTLSSNNYRKTAVHNKKEARFAMKGFEGSSIRVFACLRVQIAV